MEKEIEHILKLKKGCLFQKIPFSKGGLNRFQNRFFKVSDDLRKLIWVKDWGVAGPGRKISVKTPAVEKSCLFSDIIEVKVGVGASANLRRFYGLEMRGASAVSNTWIVISYAKEGVRTNYFPLSTVFFYVFFYLFLRHLFKYLRILSPTPKRRPQWRRRLRERPFL